MGDVSAAIEGFISDEIKLSREDISSAVKSREWFLDRIKREIEKRFNEPILYADEPFVRFGSYFKRTKVADVDEFDILVVIDSRGGVYMRNNVTMGTGLGSAIPNPLFNGNYNKTNSPYISPAKLLNWLKGVVQAVVSSFGGEAPERNGQAITAYIKSKDLKIDLVPACILQTENGRIFYVIPRGDAAGGWIETAPREDIALLDKVAKGKYRFRDVIRLCKYIKSTYNFRVSSFAIESAIVQYGQLHSRWNQCTLASNTRGALSYLSDVFKRGFIADPFDPAINMVEGVESLSWYAQRLDKIVAELEELESEIDQKKVREKVYKLFKNL